MMPESEVATRPGVSRRDFLRMAGAVGAVGVLGPVACGSPTATSPGASAARDRLRLPGVLSYELNLPSLVAQAKDYFGEENITLTDFVLGSGGPMRTAVIAKEFDFGLFAFVHVPLARGANSPWKMVLTTYDREIFSMIVRTALKDRVKKMADLRGMKVGFTTSGSGSWAMASVYLEKAGLRPDKDVQFVSLGGDTGVIYTAISTGRVDAVSAWEPITTRALESNAAFALAPIYKDEVHREYLGSSEALALGLVTREDVIKEKGDLVKRMVNAHRRGLDFIRKSSADTIADVVLKNPKTAPLFEGLDRALVIKMFERIKPGFKTGCLSKAGFKAEMDLSVKYQLVKAPITYEDFGDTKYAGSCA